MAFPVYNVKFRKAHQDNILASGEIVNGSSKNYTEAMFRILVFDKYHVLGTGIIKVHGFSSHAHQQFEVLIEGVDYRVISSIFRYEILFEGGY